MGVYLDKYFGYMLDVTEEYDKLCDENDDDILFENFISCNFDKLNKDLQELNFVPYYSVSRKHRQNDITMIYDGMCGEYCKLIFINQFERYCNDESDVNMENKFLKTIAVPDDIRGKLTKVYEIIFGKTDKQLNIQLMKLNHYH